MMRSPRSASATSSARSRSGGISSVSTSPSAWPSTSATRPESWPISARNCPGPWSITGVTWPRPSRWVIATWPDSTHEHARPGLAGLEQHFAVLVMAHLAEPAHARDLLRRQRRKGLLQAGKRACQPGAAFGAGFSRGGHSHLRLTLQKGSKTCRGPNRLFARFFSAVVMWCGGLVMGRCGREIVSPPRLRFSPLEVFTQRVLQPVSSCIFSCIFFRQMTFPAFAPVPVIRHSEPAFIRRVRTEYHQTFNGRKPGARRPAGEFGNRIGPEPAGPGRPRATRADFADFRCPAGLSRACAGRGLVARIGPPVGAFWPILYRACCRSSVVEHSIGNGEVDSSILSGSTSRFGARAL